ncbi:MAG: GTPase Era [Clostridiales bacterium]|nr:GTPase Era [Clostridiales bacterium]
MKIYFSIDTESLAPKFSEQMGFFESDAHSLAEAIGSGEYCSSYISGLLDRSYVNITYTDPEDIRAINNETRNIDSVTDVLSFPMLNAYEGDLSEPVSKEDYEKDEEGNDVLCLGDIVICLERASDQAEEFGHSLRREVAFLTAHSFLHLLGYDHLLERQEKKMTRLQKMLMRDIGLAFEDELAELASPDDDVVYPAGTPCEHCGYVSILGRPNVGKSTLINYITGMKVAIVSHRPQTTRTNVRSIYNTEDSQLIFVDTPGIHRSGNKLGKIMVGNSLGSARNADVVLLMADGRFKGPGEVELELIKVLKENGKPVVLAINKSDDVEKESLLPVIASYASLMDFKAIIPISASTGDNVDDLLNTLTELLPEGPRLFDTEYMTDQTEREICAELIREQILHYTDQEVPHGTAVVIDKFEEKASETSTDEYDRDMVVISASVICERDSHKGIILGKNGQMIKRIGTASRKSIERLLGCKVYLDIFVKVRSDWKDNDVFLKDYGYSSEFKNEDTHGF